MLGLLLTAGLKSYRDLADARAQQQDLDRHIRATEERIEVLRQRIRRIEEDPQTLERLAREQLGMVGPDDIVIVLPDDEGELSEGEPDGDSAAGGIPEGTSEPSSL